MNHVTDIARDVRRADFDDSASLANAFKGAERMLFVSTDALHAPAVRIEQHSNAIAAAVQAGKARGAIAS